MKSEFDIEPVKPECLRCGNEKKLDPLFENTYSRFVQTNFYVCANKKRCRTRQQAQRPVKMTVTANRPGPKDLTLGVTYDIQRN